MSQRATSLGGRSWRLWTSSTGPLLRWLGNRVRASAMAPAAARGRGVMFRIWSARRWRWWSSPPTSPNGRFASGVACSALRWETASKERARAGSRAGACRRSVCTSGDRVRAIPSPFPTSRSTISRVRCAASRRSGGASSIPASGGRCAGTRRAVPSDWPGGLASRDGEATTGRVVSPGACHPVSTMAEPARNIPSLRTTPAGRGAKRRRSLEPRQEEVVLHGHRMSYRTAGEGPVVLLIHGITGSPEQWNDVFPLLAQRFTVVAPDLLGHGRSAKPRGDYSLGAYAVGIRDLLIALGHRRATVVGHSLGGGIALQFAYEYPVFAERLVVVSSGGLGREVHALLRAATLPGAELVLPLIAHERVLSAGVFARRLLERIGLGGPPPPAGEGPGHAPPRGG